MARDCSTCYHDQQPNYISVSCTGCAWTNNFKNWTPIRYITTSGHTNCSCTIVGNVIWWLNPICKTHNNHIFNKREVKNGGN